MIKAKKSLGQNFLIDKNIIDKITNTVSITGNEVLEVGPGTGNLTKEILKNNPSKLYLVEKDTFLAENLKDIIDQRVKIFNEDILKVDENLLSKKISQLEIIDKVKLINNFWKEKFNKQIKIGVTGLNPHCESIDIFNEDKIIILPAIKKLQKLKYNIEGPLAADTIFLKNNRIKFDLIIGMYHDQVLTPIKTLFEYDAINVTIGLPFIRVSPDHGPNESMLGKNKSNYLSLLNSIKFLDF